MSALVLSATEQRVYRALVELADRLDLQVSHREVQSMARVAARAAKEPRPKDGEPRGVAGGRKRSGRRPTAIEPEGQPETPPRRGATAPLACA